jgi:homocitrate synthase NifV
MNVDKRLPVIVDTTLRDGLQMPGIRLAPHNRIFLLEQLAALGITEAEIGCPAQGKEEVELLRKMAAKAPSINCSVWCRARRDDVDRAMECGVATVHISFPVSERHMRIAGLSRKEVLDRLVSLVAYAYPIVRFVTIGAQDALRADSDFLREFVTTAGVAGVKRVRIADTVGSATPESAASLIRYLHEHCPHVALEYHGHDDFGLAVATTLAVIEAGVDAVSVTVNGVGERAGNAALEEVVTAAVMLYGYTSALRLETLAGLCRFVADALGIPVCPYKAISGRNAFRHESGIHCHGMLRDPLAYQPFIADAVGQRTTYSLGVQSGSSSLQAVMKNNGVTIDRRQSRTLWEQYHELF